MAEIQHTEGPWAYEHYDGVVTSPQGAICRLYNMDGDFFQDIMTTRRNGVLIASAPALLAEVAVLRGQVAELAAALRAVDEAFVNGSGPQMQGAIRHARAALARLEGEQ